MCECYQIGGRFIAEDPDCPVHGTVAQAREREIDQRIKDLESNILETLSSSGYLTFDQAVELSDIIVKKCKGVVL